MSLSKLKKGELVSLAESHGFTLDPDWTKAEIIEELEAEGIEAPNETEPDTGDGHAHVSKAERTAKLNSR